MKQFKYFGDDYLATCDLLDSLPDKIKYSFYMNGILKYENLDQAYYFMMGNYNRYRAILENFILWDFLGKYPKYEEVIMKNKGMDPEFLKQFQKKESNVYQ